MCNDTSGITSEEYFNRHVIVISDSASIDISRILLRCCYEAKEAHHIRLLFKTGLDNNYN